MRKVHRVHRGKEDWISVASGFEVKLFIGGSNKPTFGRNGCGSGVDASTIPRV